MPARVLHNAPGPYRPITDAIAALLDSAQSTLDVVNPYVTDRGMIGRLEAAARRGVRVRLFVPEHANNWMCASAQQFHHARLLDAGVAILGYPAMLHAKAFVARRRGGARPARATSRPGASSASSRSTCEVRSTELAAQFDERFLAPAAAVSTPGHAVTGFARAKAAAFAAALAAALAALAEVGGDDHDGRALEDARRADGPHGAEPDLTPRRRRGSSGAAGC